MSESEDDIDITEDIDAAVEPTDSSANEQDPAFEEFEDVTPDRTWRDTLSDAKSKFYSTVSRFIDKAKLTDSQLNTLSRWTEYGMISVITAAVLTIVGFGFNLIVAGISGVSVMLYLQIFLGCIVVAFGLFLLLIILEGGADYLASRVR